VLCTIVVVSTALLATALWHSLCLGKVLWPVLHPLLTAAGFRFQGLALSEHGGVCLAVEEELKCCGCMMIDLLTVQSS
jgi:hypothetical protein